MNGIPDDHKIAVLIERVDHNGLNTRLAHLLALVVDAGYVHFIVAQTNSASAATDVYVKVDVIGGVGADLGQPYIGLL